MSGASTLKQAEAARAQHADALAKLGAHAIGVEPVDDGWAVIAQIEPGQPFDGPRVLSTRVAGKLIDVSLRIERADMAKPE